MRGKLIRCGILAALFLGVTSVRGQDFEVGPMFGERIGGSFNLEQEAVPNFQANLADSFSWGLAGGVRFDDDGCIDCSNVQFRWLRQNTHLGLSQNLLMPSTTSSFRPNVTLDYFLGDLTHEFPLEESQAIRPLLTLTLGAMNMSAPASSATRFVFGIGTGVKVFPNPRWGFRLEVEYLAVVLQSPQRLVCGSSSCIVVLNGGITNQFQISIGPAFRF